MRILGLPADTSGCAWYRINTPIAQLKKMGHAAGIIPAGQNINFRDLYDASSLDIIVGQRLCNAPVSGEWQRIASVKGRSYRLVFEIDDDLWSVDPSNEPATEYYTKDRARLDRMIENIKVADLVTVTTEPLADLVFQWNENVAVLPNYIDEAIFGIERRPAWKFTVGCGGSKSHVGDWTYSGRAIGRFIQSDPDTIIHFIGSEFMEQMPRVPAGQVYFTPWVPVGQKYYEALRMDVGVAPLRPTIFNESKSSLKALEYAALGIPHVVADYEPYRGFVRHGETGFLAKRDDYTRYLRQLRDDDDMRAEMALRGRELAAEHTIQRNAYRWEQAYRSIL